MSTSPKEIIEQNSEQLLDKKNVVGVAYGNKYVNGEDTGEEAILVFVEKKEDLSELKNSDKVEKEIGGIQTDVVGKSGTFTKLAYTSQERPICPGISCGHLATTAGTIGGIFMDKDGHIVALSNNHVLACEAPFYNAIIFNPNGQGHITVQPGPYDGGGLGHRIGQLKNYIPLKRSGNYEDSAICIIQKENWGPGNPWYCGPVNYQLAIKNIGEIIGWNDNPTINTKVQKTGRTTGYTTGTVIGLHATVSVEYDHGTFEFKDQIVTTMMSRGGDSGSLLVDMNRNATGLLFAGSSQFTLHNPIKYPRQSYGLKIMNSVQLSEVSTINYVTVDGSVEIPFTMSNVEKAINDAKAAAMNGQNVTIEMLYNIGPKQ